MNDTKYKQGINNNAYSSSTGKEFTFIPYIIKKIVKATITLKAKQSMMLKKVVLVRTEVSKQ